MKREKKEVSLASSFMPLLFWCKCDVCREEYLWESMWRYDRWRGPMAFPSTSHSAVYVCKHCAPTKEDAEKLAKEDKERVIARHESYLIPPGEE